MASSSEEVSAFTIDAETLRELNLIEAKLVDVSAEVTAKEYLLTRPVYAERQKVIAKIPGFWAVAFDHAQSELETSFTAADAEVFAKALTALEVVRPEIPAGARASDEGVAAFGEPRSLTIRFHFADNEWFADRVLEKTLSYRYGKDETTGLVSDPVKINWKPGKDLTKGLTDAAYALWAAQKRDPSQHIDGVLPTKEARRARDAAAKNMPEYKALAKALEDNVEGSISFFNFFSYRGRWVSAAESAAAKPEVLAKRGLAVQEEDADDEDDEYEFAEEDVETFPAGHDVAVTIADDLWPNAIDYFMEDSIDSDIDLDEDDDDEDEDEDVEMS